MNSSISILIIDDNKSMAESLMDVFELKGFTSVFETTISQGIEQLKKRKHDIVLLDVNLPGQGKIEFLKKIKDYNPDSVLVLMTGYSFEDLISEAKNDEELIFLSRPLDFLKVLEEVKKSSKKGNIILIDFKDEVLNEIKKIAVESDIQLYLTNRFDDAIDYSLKADAEIIILDIEAFKRFDKKSYILIKELTQKILAILFFAIKKQKPAINIKNAESFPFYCIHKPFYLDDLFIYFEKIIKKKSRI